MALVINPDGTVSTVPADYDRNGNLSIKKGYEFESESGSQQTPNGSTFTPSQANRQNEPNKKSSVIPVTNIPSIKKRESKVIVLGESSYSSRDYKSFSVDINGMRERSLLVITKADIEKFFLNRKRKNKFVNHAEYLKILNRLKGKVAVYFTKCYHEYIKDLQIFKNTPSISITNKNKKKRKKKQLDNLLKKENGRPATPKNNSGRKPKYGYARDYFGRVQERDSFNEEKGSEFYQAQNSQKNYDYSSYDANDDHDGAYSNWD